ncbi:MAG: carboxylating nicotinate-nucleotide diphosphorylase [Pseudomonadota bacterium]
MMDDLVCIKFVNDFVEKALAEDIGKHDITSSYLIPKDSNCEFVISNKESIILSGIDIAELIFHTVDSSIKIEKSYSDGMAIDQPTKIMRGYGNARAILQAERVALNILRHLSGIATLTGQYVSVTKDHDVKILDTRKTTPLYRDLEKYAVRCGGAMNHRFRLDDGVLIKDNHIKIVGNITKAIIDAKKLAPFLTKIEVECDNLTQVEEAIKAKADVIMLDNMSIDIIKQAVAIINKQCLIEVSGNISLENIANLCKTGIDYISVGRLTHSAPNVDLGLAIL